MWTQEEIAGAIRDEMARQFDVEEIPAGTIRPSEEAVGSVMGRFGASIILATAKVIAENNQRLIDELNRATRAE